MDGVTSLTFSLRHELRKLIAEEADREAIPLGEVVTRACAAYFSKPKLANIPRKLPGRPKK